MRLRRAVSTTGTLRTEPSPHLDLAPQSLASRGEPARFVTPKRAYTRPTHQLPSAPVRRWRGFMRTTHRCIKCQGTKLYVCENRQPNHRYSNSVVNFNITSVRLTDEGGSESRSDVGAYETWICAACYTEWYALDKDGALERLSKVADSGVRVVESGAASPFR
jgi:hypothetical protein